MADYASLKVPELKKLLQERGLTTGGNKADLVARLKENDGTQDSPAPAPAEPSAAPPAAAPAAAPAPAEDEIDYSDDEVKIKTSQSAPAPATEPTEPDQDPPAEPKSFALNLPSTSADDEARRRTERAKRFGTDSAQDDDVKRRAERAARFGLGDNSMASLDAALPDGRPPKRGRAQGRDDAERAAKRQSTDRNAVHGGRRSGRNAQPSRGGQGKKTVPADTEEKRKAEERKKRFAAA